MEAHCLVATVLRFRTMHQLDAVFKRQMQFFKLLKSNYVIVVQIGRRSTFEHGWVLELHLIPSSDLSNVIRRSCWIETLLCSWLDRQSPLYFVIFGKLVLLKYPIGLNVLVRSLVVWLKVLRYSGCSFSPRPVVSFFSVQNTLQNKFLFMVFAS